jgi:hypothetical protein
VADAGTYTAAVLLICFAPYRLAVDTGRARDPALRWICWFAVCTGLALAVLAPASMAALGGWSPLRHAAVLAGAELKLAGLTSLALFARELEDPGHGTGRRFGRQALAVIAAMAVLFTAAVPAARGPGPLPVPSRCLLAGYDLLFVVHSVRCLVLFGTLVARHARRIGPSPLRTGLRLMTAAGALAVVWTLWLLPDVVDVLRHGRQDSAEDLVSALLAAACALLAVGGATAAVWGRALEVPARTLRALRAYRTLEPLWSALYEAHPGIALTPGRRARPGWLPRRLRFALYRRVIEIHDGRLSLRPYCPADASAWLAEHRPQAASQPPSAALLEAASLAAGLEARRAGVRAPVAAGASGTAAAGSGRPAGGAVGPGPASAPPGTIDAELEWLLLVAEAFTALVAVPAPGAAPEQVRT